jgi:hypothetical protein
MPAGSTRKWAASVGIVSFLSNDSGPCAACHPGAAGCTLSRGGEPDHRALPSPARRNPRLNQPTLTMDTIGAIGRIAAIFTLITPSHDC